MPCLLGLSEFPVAGALPDLDRCAVDFLCNIFPQGLFGIPVHISGVLLGLELGVVLHKLNNCGLGLVTEHWKSGNSHFSVLIFGGRG